MLLDAKYGFGIKSRYKWGVKVPWADIRIESHLNAFLENL
jgi:hypothetical protein